MVAGGLAVAICSPMHYFYPAPSTLHLLPRISLHLILIRTATSPLVAYLSERLTIASNCPSQYPGTMDTAGRQCG